MVTNNIKISLEDSTNNNNKWEDSLIRAMYTKLIWEACPSIYVEMKFG